MDASPVRYTVRFTGMVQGVGFRATAVSVAQGFRVAGWVRNEPDGSVQCVAEGEADELDRFINAVKRAMQGNIDNVTIETGPASGEFSDFHVRY